MTTEQQLDIAEEYLGTENETGVMVLLEMFGDDWSQDDARRCIESSINRLQGVE